jgi:proteic killer suppression protein
LILNAARYTIIPLIRSFKSKETEKIFNRERSTRLPHDIQQVALRKLRMLNRAATLQDLRVPPANRLEKLVDDRAGQYSIRINDQWRICFEWRDKDAFNVEIVDYH